MSEPGRGASAGDGHSRALAAWLDHAIRSHREDNFLAVKQGTYLVGHKELEGEVVDWTLQYLHYLSCPANLEAGVTKAVVDEVKNQYLANGNGETSEDPGAVEITVDSPVSRHGLPNKGAFKSMTLLQNVTSTVNEVCKRLKQSESSSEMKTPRQIVPGRVTPCSVVAVKNGRRKMEDRHTVIHDCNIIFQDISEQMASEPALSFYAVYDGHAGKDAAAFAAAHVHEHVFTSPAYPSDPVQAIKDAFTKTDQVFLDKGKTEALRSGTTAVCCLIRGNTMYSAWLGDSQAVLVRNGTPLNINNPHKPNREDEKQRIESLGGTVIHWGTWRVNGQLAVSRAIGDGDYKPYVSAMPDITTIEMDGTEDFIVIGCDGLWDTVTPEQATLCVFEQLRENSEELDLVSQRLVALSKDQGSTDNITIVTVFLRPIEELAQKAESVLAQANDETDGPDYQQLYRGITSTSSYVKLAGEATSDSQKQHDDMNGSQDLDAEAAAAANPFSQSGSNGTYDDPFSSPALGATVKDSKEEMMAAMAEDASAQQMMPFDTSNEFKRASPSMFDSPSTAFDFSGKESGEGAADAVDFMANQESSWIGQPAGAAGAAAAAAAHPSVAALNQQQHPFLHSKNDSGFISPACASNNQSASSEDSAENHAERETTSPESDHPPSEPAQKVDEDADEEDEVAEAAQVAQLLAQARGGSALDELMSLSDKDDGSHTPPMDDDNDPNLEDILAAARNLPESADAEDDSEDDSSEAATSSDDESSPPLTKPPILMDENQEIVQATTTDTTVEAFEVERSQVTSEESAADPNKPDSLIEGDSDEEASSEAVSSSDDEPPPVTKPPVFIDDDQKAMEVKTDGTTVEALVVQDEEISSEKTSDDAERLASQPDEHSDEEESNLVDSTPFDAAAPLLAEQPVLVDVKEDIQVVPTPDQPEEASEVEKKTADLFNDPLVDNFTGKEDLNEDVSPPCNDVPSQPTEPQILADDNEEGQHVQTSDTQEEASEDKEHGAPEETTNEMKPATLIDEDPLEDSTKADASVNAAPLLLPKEPAIADSNQKTIEPQSVDTLEASEDKEHGASEEATAVDLKPATPIEADPLEESGKAVQSSNDPPLLLMETAFPVDNSEEAIEVKTAETPEVAPEEEQARLEEMAAEEMKPASIINKDALEDFKFGTSESYPAPVLSETPVHEEEIQENIEAKVVDPYEEASVEEQEKASLEETAGDAVKSDSPLDEPYEDSSKAVSSVSDTPLLVPESPVLIDVNQEDLEVQSANIPEEASKVEKEEMSLVVTAEKPATPLNDDTLVDSNKTFESGNDAPLLLIESPVVLDEKQDLTNVKAVDTPEDAFEVEKEEVPSEIAEKSASPTDDDNFKDSSKITASFNDAPLLLTEPPLIGDNTQDVVDVKSPDTPEEASEMKKEQLPLEDAPADTIQVASLNEAPPLLAEPPLLTEQPVLVDVKEEIQAVPTSDQSEEASEVKKATADPFNAPLVDDLTGKDFNEDASPPCNDVPQQPTEPQVLADDNKEGQHGQTSDTAKEASEVEKVIATVIKPASPTNEETKEDLNNLASTAFNDAPPPVTNPLVLVDENKEVQEVKTLDAPVEASEVKEQMLPEKTENDAKMPPSPMDSPSDKETNEAAASKPPLPAKSPDHVEDIQEVAKVETVNTPVEVAVVDKKPEKATTEAKKPASPSKKPTAPAKRPLGVTEKKGTTSTTSRTRAAPGTSTAAKSAPKTPAARSGPVSRPAPGRAPLSATKPGVGAATKKAPGPSVTGTAASLKERPTSTVGSRVGATKPASSLTKRTAPTSTRPTPSAATTTRPGSAPKPTVSKVTPTPRPTASATAKSRTTTGTSVAAKTTTASSRPTAGRTPTSTTARTTAAASRTTTAAKTNGTAPTTRKPLSNGAPAASRSTTTSRTTGTVTKPATKPATTSRPGSSSSNASSARTTKSTVSSRVAAPRSTTTPSSTPNRKPPAAGARAPVGSRPGVGVAGRPGVKKPAAGPLKTTTKPKEEKQPKNTAEDKSGEVNGGGDNTVASVE